MYCCFSQMIRSALTDTNSDNDASSSVLAFGPADKEKEDTTGEQDPLVNAGTKPGDAAGFELEKYECKNCVILKKKLKSIRSSFSESKKRNKDKQIEIIRLKSSEMALKKV